MAGAAGSAVAGVMVALAGFAVLVVGVWGHWGDVWHHAWRWRAVRWVVVFGTFAAVIEAMTRITGQSKVEFVAVSVVAIYAWGLTKG